MSVLELVDKIVKKNNGIPIYLFGLLIILSTTEKFAIFVQDLRKALPDFILSGISLFLLITIIAFLFLPAYIILRKLNSTELTHETKLEINRMLDNCLNDEGINPETLSKHELENIRQHAHSKLEKEIDINQWDYMRTTEKFIFDTVDILVPTGTILALLDSDALAQYMEFLIPGSIPGVLANFTNFYLLIFTFFLLIFAFFSYKISRILSARIFSDLPRYKRCLWVFLVSLYYLYLIFYVYRFLLI